MDPDVPASSWWYASNAFALFENESWLNECCRKKRAMDAKCSIQMSITPNPPYMAGKVRRWFGEVDGRDKECFKEGKAAWKAFFSWRSVAVIAGRGYRKVDCS